MKHWKKLVIITAALGLLCACTAYWEDTVQDGVTYHISRSGKEAFAAEYSWDVNSAQTKIIIADTVDGAKVTQIGGFFGTGVPSPFAVLPADSGIRFRGAVPDPDDFGQEVRFATTEFTVKIGKNVEKIVSASGTGWAGVRDAYGNVTFIQPYCSFVCDPDNPVFYAEDGILYDRSEGKEVPELAGMREAGPAGMLFDTLSFGKKLTGRYVSRINDDEMLVLEVFPAFGSVYVNIGSYAGGTLQSSSGAVLVPAVEFEYETGDWLSDPEQTSLPMALELIPGDSGAVMSLPKMPVVCEVSVSEEGLELRRTDSGEAVFGDGFLPRDRTAPAQFPVLPADTASMYTDGERMREWYPVNPLVLKDLETETCRMKIWMDGTAVLVRKDTEVPEVYRGICTIAFDTDMRYCFTKLGGGTEQYTGRVTTAQTEDGQKVFRASEGWESGLLIPEGTETLVTVN
ncbi:MAG: hypothetical protein IKF51_06700 [Solobacterium sp.]|nr:hypothetical protein [Solobacterium sp.]